MKMLQKKDKNMNQVVGNCCIIQNRYKYNIIY